MLKQGQPRVAEVETSMKRPHQEKEEEEEEEEEKEVKVEEEEEKVGTSEHTDHQRDTLRKAWKAG